MTTPLNRIRSGGIALTVIFALSVIGFHVVGGYGWVESLWMVVITISTVGYGEQSSASTAMQLLMMAVILMGVSASAYTFGGFIQLMLEGEIDRILGRRKVTKELNRLDDHVIICGFGKLGRDLATQLKHRSIPFIIVDLSEEKVEAASELGFLAIEGDATSEKILEQVRIEKAKALAAALPTDAENVFITLTARNLRPAIQIIAKAEQETSCRKLRQAGANKVIMPHRIGAQQMERMISRPSTADLVELFAEASHLEMELDELQVDEHSPIADKSLADSRIRDDFNLLVVGIRDSEGHFRFNPEPHEKICVGNILLVMGEVPDINRLKSSRL